MYKDKKRCLKCSYGYFPAGAQKFLGEPMCLYYHDTGKHRDGDDYTCNSFKKLTPEEIKQRQKENRRGYENAKQTVYY